VGEDVAGFDEVYRELDSMPMEEWLVPPWRSIEPEDRLRPDEMELLERIVKKRRPELLERLGRLGVDVQKPSEREELRDVVLEEQLDLGDQMWNEYGSRLDDLLGRLGRI